MSCRCRPGLLALSLAGLAMLGGCGAGLITGVAASSGGGSRGDAPPLLSISTNLPLHPAAGTRRTVVVANAQIPASAPLRVTITAAQQTVEQPNASVTGQGGSTEISFELATAAIRAAVADPTAGDVVGQLHVLVGAEEVAPPAPILLLRQPRAYLPGAAPLFLSPLGQVVTVNVDGLVSSDPNALQMLVTTRDPDGVAVGGAPPTVTRLCTGLELSTLGGAPAVRAVVPGNTFPTHASLVVRDAVAGESTSVENVYYRPDISLALPSQGPTTGGDLVHLNGTALVPVDFTSTATPKPLAFGAVHLSFAKDGRVTDLPLEEFRAAESNAFQLVFTMPASPDGRPGQVDIVLRVDLEGGVTAEVTATQKFLFANPQPFFGPRGIVLDHAPVAVRAIALDDAPGPAIVEDFAVLTEQSGVAFLQLLLAQENGMFQPFAVPRQIGSHEVAAEHQPRDMCSGDFDGDHVPDLFIANVGATTAVHHVVLGRARPQTPLGDVFKFTAQAGTTICRAARIDGDALTDVVLVPGPDAAVGALPRVWLARPTGIGMPAFTPPIDLPVRALRYDAVEIADFDGDGFADIALLAGATLQLDVAWGDGFGNFVATQKDFAIPGYQPAPDSPAVGVHACANPPLQSLAVVMAGLSNVPATLPAVAVLGQGPPRVFHDPLPGSLLTLIEPLGQSIVADLDRQPPIELALAARDEPQVASLGLLQFNGTGFSVAGGIDTGSERPLQISGLHFGAAFPPTQSLLAKDALFVVHESEIDGVRERRLSTRLIVAPPVSASLTLLPPDAGNEHHQPIEAIVSGNFHPTSIAGGELVRDLALARSGAVDLSRNDGYGGFPGNSLSLAQPGLLPHSLALRASPPGSADTLVFCDASSRLGIWLIDPETLGSTVLLGSELRLASSILAHHTTDIVDATRIRVGDVDGDGVLDVVALLVFAATNPGEGDAAIALLRGKASPAAGELPFHVPTALTPVHGNASSMTLGDFARDTSGGPTQLELAVAIPVGSQVGAIDGNHVRFFRYHAGATPADDVLLPSAQPQGVQVMLAGVTPQQVAAADFDRDGRVDLLVACAGDRTLRLFRNVSLPGSGNGEVEIEAFVESLSSPQQLPPGTPRALRLGDVNGDGNVDAIVAVEFRATPTSPPTTAVVFHLSSGAGAFGTGQTVSPTRVGDLGAPLALDVGDWNRDGVLDLFLGWGVVVPGVRNLRILFGGTR